MCLLIQASIKKKKLTKHCEHSAKSRPLRQSLAMTIQFPVKRLKFVFVVDHE